MVAPLCYLTSVARHLSATVPFVLFLALASCPRQVPLSDNHPGDAGVSVTPPPTVSTRPGLIIKVQPDDAMLFIDGVNYGAISKLGTIDGLLELKSGIYQVAIKRSGFLSWRAEVTINDGPEMLAVTLNPQ